jgi:MoaA/NifB/PqqE/SkfB family radical SAM enzyme
MSRLGRRLYTRVYEGLNSRLRYLAGGRFASRCRPTWVSILLTERCNARCLHCDIWKNRGKEDSPTAEQWKAVLADLRSWLGPVHVCITGGEALLAPAAVEVIQHGCAAGLELEVLTHGYWQDQTRIEAMARANPWRITLSVDGLGEVHSKVRGREGFHYRTFGTIQNLIRLRRTERLDYSIQLKTVVMEHNLDQLAPIAGFAADNGLLVFYQPIEQNYNTREDPRWFESSSNWPRDPEEAVRAVEGLIALKRQGFPIGNSLAQLEVMIPYFRDPASLRLATQGHSAHDEHRGCSALSLIQVQSNGDVRVCAGSPPVGNIKGQSIRKVWAERPTWWLSGCCLERRMTPEEREAIPVT